MNAPTGDLFASPSAVAVAADHMDILRALAEAPEHLSLATPDRLAAQVRRPVSEIRSAVAELEKEGLVCWSGEPAVPTLTRKGAWAALGVGVATGEAEIDTSAIFLTHDQVRPNPNNPRRKIVETEIDGIADTIPAKGILQPLLVYPAGEDGVHMLSAGEKRWRAVGRAIERGTIEPGFRIPCRLTQPTEEEAAVQAASTALVENGARSDLSMLEKARAFRIVVEGNPGLPIAEIARRHDIDPRTGQEMLKVLREADPAHVALCEAGDPEWKWEKLRDSVKTVKLSPAQTLIVLEVAARMDSEEAAIEGADGPPWIEAAFTPHAGPHMDLVARGLLQFTVYDGVPLCRLRTDNPRLEGWLDAAFGCEPGERRSLDPDARAAVLFQARATELGSFTARQLEQDDKFATPWLIIEPVTLEDVHNELDEAAPLGPRASTPAAAPAAPSTPQTVFDSSTPSDDEALYRQALELVIRDRKATTAYVQRKLQIGGYLEAAALMQRMEREGVVGPVDHTGAREVLAPAPAASQLEGDAGRPGEKETPEPQTAARAAPTPHQRMILAEILHKAAHDDAHQALIKPGALLVHEMDAMLNRGWVMGRLGLGPNGEDVLAPTESAFAALGLLPGWDIAGDLITSRRDDARKDAGLSLARRHELAQTGRYAWEPLNTQASKAATPPAEDELKLDPETALALVELAAAIARDGVTLAGKPWRCVAVFDYHLHRAASEFGFHKLAAWITHNGQWFGYLKERGERWLKAQGLNPAAVGAADAARFRDQAGKPATDAWSTPFLNPQAAKPTGPVREEPAAKPAEATASGARGDPLAESILLLEQLAADARWAAEWVERHAPLLNDVDAGDIGRARRIADRASIALDFAFKAKDRA